MKRTKFALVLLVLFSIFGVCQSNWDLIEKYGNPKDYPDQDLIEIFSRENIRFEADGSYVANTHQLIKILSQRGLQMMGTQDVSYYKRYQQAEIQIAKIYHANKTIDTVPEANIKDQSITETQQMNIFEENFRKKTILLANLAIGDTVELQYQIKSQALVKNNYCAIFGFQDFNPSKRKIVTINGPGDKPLYYIVKNGKIDCQKKINPDGRIEYIWETIDCQPLKNEQAMASSFDIATKLIVSTYQSWEELSRYAASLNQGKIDTSPEMVKKVEELTNGIPDEKEKIKRIFNFISQEIRYMGSAMDIATFIEPHQASYTFEKKYGICRDKSILFIAMLKEIGIKAEDVVVNVSIKTDPEIPTIYFQHAIVAVYLGTGKIVYMDPTLELSTALGEPYIGGNYVLHLSDPGKPLMLVPQASPQESMGQVSVKSILDQKNNLKLSAEISGVGTYDFFLRTLGKQLPGMTQAFLWQKLLQELNPTAKIIKADASNPTELAKPYKVNLDVEIPDYLSQLGNVYMMKLPMGDFSLDLLLGLAANALTKLPERKYPIFAFSPAGSEIVAEVKIPEEYEMIAYPDSFTFSEKPFFLKIQVTETGKNVIKMTSTFTYDTDYISTEEYKVLKTLMKKIDKFSRCMIILKKGDKK